MEFAPDGVGVGGGRLIPGKGVDGVEEVVGEDEDDFFDAPGVVGGAGYADVVLGGVLFVPEVCW